MYSPSCYFCVLLLLLAFASTMEYVRNYSGHKVVRMVPKTESHLNKIRILRSTNNELDFWTEPNDLDNNVDVRVHPDDLEELTNQLQEENIVHSVVIEDIQTLIDDQQDDEDSKETEENSDDAKPRIAFTKYHRIDAIHDYLDDLATEYPDFVKVDSIGKSYEGRDLPVIKIGRSSNNCTPSIWIDAGIHAREWIAPATALYVIDQLTNHAEIHRDLVDSVDWFILPSANPDGYEFSHSEDRFWRKTRSRSDENPGCRGVDANRNFDFHYNEGGSSSDPCSQIYRGPKAFSESEPKAIADFLLAHRSSLKVYVSLHAYGQVILTPWAYTYELPDDFDEMYEVAAEAVNALSAVNGTKYRIGSTAHIMYVSSGSSMDYAKGMAGIKYAFAAELRDKGEYGFLLPPNQIIPTGMETWEALKYFAKLISRAGNEC